MYHFGDFEHHFQVSIGDYISVYPQQLGDVQLEHLPTPVKDVQFWENHRSKML